MKRILSVIMLLALAAALCACGNSYGSHACAGKWKCVSAPIQMKYSDIRLELTDTSFTYTLVAEKSTTVMTGTAKSIGEKSMVLYVVTQQQLDGTTSRVMQERTVWQKIGDGFAENTVDLWDGIVNVFIWLLSSLPYLIPLALVAVFGFKFGKKLRSKKAKKTEKPEA